MPIHPLTSQLHIQSYHERQKQPYGRHFFFQAEDGIRDLIVTGVQTCALPIWRSRCRKTCTRRSSRRDASPSTRRGGASCNTSAGLCATWIRNRSARSSRSGTGFRSKRPRGFTGSSAGARSCSRTTVGSARLCAPIRASTPGQCARWCARRARNAARAGRHEPIASCSGRCAISSRIRNRFPTMTANEELLIGLVSISDRASSGVYKDEGIPALEEWFRRVMASPWRMETRLIPDERSVIESTLLDLIDRRACHLVLTTGGTGPAPRDVTPEATLAIADKPMPGFGEQMRRISLEFVPTAILSRQVAVVRKRSLVINLPGQPKSIRETLEGLKDKDGKQIVAGIFAAVPYCIDLIGGPYIETHEEVVRAFRPKSAIRPRAS